MQIIIEGVRIEVSNDRDLEEPITTKISLFMTVGEQRAC